MVWLSLVTAHRPAPIQCPTSHAGVADLATRLAAAAPPCISGRTSYLQVRLAFHLYPQVIPPFCNTGGFGPRRGLTPASPCPWVAHLVSGRIPATGFIGRPLQTRFRSGSSALPRLNHRPRVSSRRTTTGLLLPYTRRIILQKARRQAVSRCRNIPRRRPPTACQRRGSEALSSPSRGAFHLSLTVLVHYRWPGVFAPWRVVPPASHRVSRAPWYSGTVSTCPAPAVRYGTLTRSGGPSQTLRVACAPHMRPFLRRDRHCPLNPNPTPLRR